MGMLLLLLLGSGGRLSGEAERSLWRWTRRRAVRPGPETQLSWMMVMLLLLLLQTADVSERRRRPESVAPLVWLLLLLLPLLHPP